MTKKCTYTVVLFCVIGGYNMCVCVCSPPVPVGVDAQGRTIPGEVPKLFGGELVKYILVSTFML